MSLSCFVRSWLWIFSRQRRTRKWVRKPALEELEQRQLLSTNLSLPLHLDFGTSKSPVAPGYIGVRLVAYTSSVGYGWATLTGMSASDRGTADPLTRDLHRGQDNTFLVDLPNGTYDVTATLGDARYQRDTLSIWAEGQPEVSGLTTNIGQFLRPTFRVQVSDGQLDLRVAGIGGNNPYFSINAVDIVPVAQPLVANAGPDLVAQEGAPVSFAGSATGGAGLLSYWWNFGDGSTAPGTLTPTHTYADNGTYTVTLTVTDGLGKTGKDTAVVTVTSVAPTANSGGPYTGTVGAAITFTATATDPSPVDTAAGFTYQWSFGDGTTGSGATTSHAYAAIGTYTVTLTVKDKDGAASTVTTTASIDWASNFTSSNWLSNWNVRSYGSWGMQDVGTLADPTGQFDQVLRVQYPAGSASPTVSRTYGAPLGGAQWYGDLGMAPADSLRLRYFVRFADNFDFVKGGKLPGFFGGKDVSGGQIPDGTNGFSTRYMWRTGGAGEVYAYLPTSTSYGTSLGRGSWTFVPGRWYLLEQEVSLNTPGVSDGYVKVWVDGQLVLNATGLLFRTVDSLKIEGIFFSTFFGGSDPSWETPVDTYADFADFAVSKTPLPVANAGPNLVGQEGTALNFAGSAFGGQGALSYLWNFGDGATLAGTLTPTHTYADNGTYTVALTITDSLGFTSTDTLTVTVNNVAPTASTGGPYTGTVASPITFTGSASDPSPLDTAVGFTFLWDFGDGSTSTGRTPSHLYANAGLFTVSLTVIDKDGGATTVTTTATIT